MSVATAVRRMASSAIITGALVASSAVAVQAQTFFGTGGNVTVRFLSFNAADRSVLAYKIGGTNATTGGSAYFNLFANNGAAPAGGGPGGTSNTVFTTNNIAAQIVIGPVAVGTQVFFRLTNETTPAVYYNDASNAAFNSDGQLHSAAQASPGGAAVGGGTFTTGFGFEDRNYPPTTFLDFNDLNFDVAGTGPATITPEPSSVVLMLSGLLALGVAARRRRRV